MKNFDVSAVVWHRSGGRAEDWCRSPVVVVLDPVVLVEVVAVVLSLSPVVVVLDPVVVVVAVAVVLSLA